jgi:hypothetical protein
VQEGGRGKYRFSEASWRPVTAPATRRAAHAMAAAACSATHHPPGCTLPQIAGFGSRQVEAAGAAEAPAPDARPWTSAASSRSEGSARAGSPDRRPMTAEGSSPYATALRQLEREQLRLVRPGLLHPRARPRRRGDAGARTLRHHARHALWSQLGNTC